MPCSLSHWPPSTAPSWYALMPWLRDCSCMSHELLCVFGSCDGLCADSVLTPFLFPACSLRAWGASSKSLPVGCTACSSSWESSGALWPSHCCSGEQTSCESRHLLVPFRLVHKHMRPGYKQRTWHSWLCPAAAGLWLMTCATLMRQRMCTPS
jgi:hypothetical protein